MIATALAFGLAAAQAPDTAATTVVRKPVAESRLEIPDEIAPAVMPYLGCLFARDGVQVRGGMDPRPPGIGPGADCAPFRERAAIEADRLLQGSGQRSGEDRAAIIERTLSSIDAFITPQPRPRAAESQADAQD